MRTKVPARQLLIESDMCRRLLVYLGPSVFCLMSFCERSDIWGEEPAPPSVGSPETVEQQTPARKLPRILVLHSLEVVEGLVSVENGVCRVMTADGEIFIATSNVLFDCSSREEAYLLLKPRVIPNNPDHHVSLAKWCARNELPEEARDELQAAIRLNPDNEEYRYLLQQAEELLNPYRTAEDINGTKPDRFNLSEAILQRVEPLGGMTRSQAREFTSRVQPILVNGCATSHCHGEGNRAKLSFSLSPSSGYSSLQTTQRNLDRIVSQINKEDPKLSRLLTVHRETDDGIESPFDKPHGKALERTVMRWIASLGSPEPEMEIPPETGPPRTANIVAEIARNRNRRERRQRAAANLRESKVNSLSRDESPGGFLSELLTEEMTEGDRKSVV